MFIVLECQLNFDDLTVTLSFIFIYHENRVPNTYTPFFISLGVSFRPNSFFGCSGISFPVLLCKFG